MEILKRKGFVQKIIITLIVLIMFNFVVPNYAMAADQFGWGWGGGSLVSPICEFVCWVGDSIIGFLQNRFLPNSPSIVTTAHPIDLIIQSLEDEENYIQNSIDSQSGLSENERLELEREKAEATYEKLKYQEIKEEYNDLYNGRYRWWIFEAPETQGAHDYRQNLRRELLDKYGLDSVILEEQSVANIFYGPLTIFSNLVPALDINFINPELSYGGVKNINYGQSLGHIYVKSYVMNENKKDPQDAGNIAKSLQREIASWYNALRNLAIVFLLSVLIYIAIRIILSSAAGETAKYKSMLKDWLIALCILFFMHYFMAFLLKSTEMITQFFTSNTSNQMYVDGFMSELRNKIPAESDALDQWADTVMYFTLVCYTLMFTWRYLKRVVYLAFLTMVSPLVAFTYPIDKIKDGSAQAFNKWFKEYLFNILIQPVHLLLYTVLITSAKDLANTNIFYSLVALGFMLEAEKIVKDFFGFQAQRGESTGAAITGGAIFAATVGLVQKGLGFLPEGDGGKGDKSKPRHSSRQKDVKASKRVENAWIPDNNGETPTGNQPRTRQEEGGAATGGTGGTQARESRNEGTAGIQYGDLRNRALSARVNPIMPLIETEGGPVIGDHTVLMNENDYFTDGDNFPVSYSMNSNSIIDETSQNNSNATNILGGNVPGSIQNATIQNATIQNATISQGANIHGQGANLQGQSTSRVSQTGGTQGGSQTGNAVRAGSTVGINQSSQGTQQGNEEDQDNETNSNNRSFWRGLKFVAKEEFSRNNLRKGAKKALRLGLMGAGAATLGTMRLGAGLAGNGTDDVVKYTGMGLGLGAMAGKKGYGLIQEAYHDDKRRLETFNEGYYGEKYQDEYYGPKLDKEYKNDPEVRKHYQMYYGDDWDTALNNAIELRKMGITDQDDIDIALQKVRSGENENLSLEQVASIIGLYKAYSRKDLEDKKYQNIIYNNALSSMTNGNKQAAERIVNAVMKSRNAHGRFVMPNDDEEENS